MLNIGFIEALKRDNYSCFIFSDVDHLSESELNIYNCHTSPLHMSSSVDVFKYEIPYPKFFGGVEAFNANHYKAVNGFSNLYWGWGGEDDDICGRVLKIGLKIQRLPLFIGRYTMNRINHKVSDGPNPNRYKLLKKSSDRMMADGLNSVEYEIKKVIRYKLYTHIIIHTSPSMYKSES